jgi:hypothetical protein
VQHVTCELLLMRWRLSRPRGVVCLLPISGWRGMRVSLQVLAPHHSAASGAEAAATPTHAGKASSSGAADIAVTVDSPGTSPSATPLRAAAGSTTSTFTSVFCGRRMPMGRRCCTHGRLWCAGPAWRKALTITAKSPSESPSGSPSGSPAATPARGAAGGAVSSTFACVSGVASRRHELVKLAVRRGVQIPIGAGRRCL